MCRPDETVITSVCFLNQYKFNVDCVAQGEPVADRNGVEPNKYLISPLQKISAKHQGIGEYGKQAGTATRFPWKETSETTKFGLQPRW
jgi:hypothetical protein